MGKDLEIAFSHDIADIFHANWSPGMLLSLQFVVGESLQ